MKMGRDFWWLSVQHSAGTMVEAFSNFTEDAIVLCRKSFVAHHLDDLVARTRFWRYSLEKRIDNGSLWIAEPTMYSVIIYSVLIPIISALGIIGNALILVVLSGKELRASMYTYLAVLAAADLVTCALLLFSGLSRGVFWCRTGWLEFDAFVHIPVGSVSSNITVWAAVFVTLDRLLIVCGPPRCKPPKFCDPLTARKSMISCACLALLINIPYCFIYGYNEAGELTTTKFFHSCWYNLQNWIQLIMFGLIPAAFLLVANGILCIAVWRALGQRHLLLRRKCLREESRLRDQTRLTVMLVGIVLVFVVGEVPTHLASRRSAVSLLYGGDPTKVHVAFMERFRMYATLLNATASSANFVFYCLLSPRFLLHLKRIVLSKDATTDGAKTTRRMAAFRHRSRDKDGTKLEVFVL